MDPAGSRVLSADLSTLGFRTPAGRQRVTRVLSSRQDGSSYDAVLATTDPQRTIRLRLRPDTEGVLALEARVEGGEVQTLSMACTPSCTRTSPPPSRSTPAADCR